MSGKVSKIMKNHKGFTLVELVIIIVVLGILSTFAAFKYTSFVEESRVTATQAEMNEIRRAIIGNSQLIAGGKYIDIGYEGNVGSLPDQLQDLITKPGTVANYNAISGLGWNGPYLKQNNDDYLTDAWGKSYVFDPSARTIKSVGSGADLVVSF